jgi:hypothetical protein
MTDPYTKFILQQERINGFWKKIVIQIFWILGKQSLDQISLDIFS